MSRSHLMTDWICIATEGETVDKRDIPAQWLYDMAESYSTEEYTALLWPDHERWFGNVGEVLALKCEKVGERVKLYAQLCPAQDLLYANRNGKLLFCSIEPTTDLNYKGTGKPYLEGLGVTDSPASTGTERMRFNAKNAGRIFGQLEPLVFSDVSELSEEDMSSTQFSDKKRLFRSLFSLPEKTEKQPPENQPEPKPEKHKKGLFSKMKFSDEQIETLVEVVEAVLEESEEQAEIIEEIKTQVAELKETVEEALEEIKEEVGGEEFKRFKKQLKDVDAKFNKLDRATTQLPDNNPGDKGGNKFAF